MAKFKKGDIVIVKRPADRTEWPNWSEEMDEFDGGKFIIATNPDHSLVFLDMLNADGITYTSIGSYVFNTGWLRPARKEIFRVTT